MSRLIKSIKQFNGVHSRTDLKCTVICADKSIVENLVPLKGTISTLSRISEINFLEGTEANFSDPEDVYSQVTNDIGVFLHLKVSYLTKIIQKSRTLVKKKVMKDFFLT